MAFHLLTLLLQRRPNDHGKGSSYGGSYTEYRTERDQTVKIVAGPRADSGSRQSFTVYGKQRRIMTFGGSENSVFPSLEDPLYWYVAEEKDRSGNYMTYEYLQDTDATFKEYLLFHL